MSTPAVSGPSRISQRLGDLFDTQVSTRSLGLLRIVGCGAILCRFDGLWAPRHFQQRPERLALVLVFSSRRCSAASDLTHKLRRPSC